MGNFKTEQNQTRVVVIGSGPGGYVAAIKAAILGADVTVVETNHVGGVCLNKGCIPTKALLSSAEVLKTAGKSSLFGISISGSIDVDFSKITHRKDQVVGQLVYGIKYLFDKHGIKLIEGKGKLADTNSVEIILNDGGLERITADKIILATGSLPVIPSLFNYDGTRVITSDEALNIKELPDSLLIIGGGVIGCEFGQFFSNMGTMVTIVEMADHLLPMEDDDVATQITFKLEQEGIDIHTGCSVSKVEPFGEKVMTTLSTGEEITSDKVLISIGRKANFEGLGIEKVGIKIDGGKIWVDQTMETSSKGIYAIGDLVNSPFLAHVASREASVAVENIMGIQSHVSYHAVPRCVYTDPQIACVGLTERDAQEKGIDYSVGKFNYSGLGKAHLEDRLDGAFKIITNKEDQIIGASIVGSHATDLLAELTLAVHLGLTAKQVGEVIHPHPTFSEGILEALHDVHHECVHAL